MDTAPNHHHIVISADCHAGPRKPADYRPYVDPGFRADFDAWVEREEHATLNLFGATPDETSAVGDEAFRERRTAQLVALGVQEDAARCNVEAHYRSEASIAGAWDSEARNAALEHDGIVAEVIHPDGVFGTRIPFRSFGVSPKPEFEAAGKRAYNRWLADLCNELPGRRAGIIQIALHDVDAALREIEDAVARGLTGGVGLPGLQTDVPGYNHPCYEPLWSLCEQMGLALSHHGGTPAADARVYGSDPFEVAALNSVEVGVLARRPLLFLMFGGVFDRHPGLKLVLAETFANWVPGWLRQLDDHVEQFWMSGIRQRLALRPSEYWFRHCHVAASFLSRSEAEVRDAIGLENLLWGADYPHIEGTQPYSRESLRATFAGLPEADVRTILAGNAARVYGFDLDALQARADVVGPSHEELSVPFRIEDKPADYIGSGFRR